jgi:hypothetical protein
LLVGVVDTQDAGMVERAKGPNLAGKALSSLAGGFTFPKVELLQGTPRFACCGGLENLSLTASGDARDDRPFPQPIADAPQN